MGIKKETVVTITYVCDNKNCGKADKDELLYATDIPVIRNGAKDKLVLCDDCFEEHNEFMARYGEEADPGAVPEVEEYDPQTCPRMQKLSPDDRTKHHAAKVWALGPDSTMPKTARPEGVKFPAGEKVLVAYEIFLREQEIKAEALRRTVAEAEAATNAPGAIAFKNGKAAT